MNDSTNKANKIYKTAQTWDLVQTDESRRIIIQTPNPSSKQSRTA